MLGGVDLYEFNPSPLHRELAKGQFAEQEQIVEYHRLLIIKFSSGDRVLVQYQSSAATR
jgi:hypothetical protein